MEMCIRDRVDRVEYTQNVQFLLYICVSSMIMESRPIPVSYTHLEKIHADRNCGGREGSGCEVTNRDTLTVLSTK